MRYPVYVILAVLALGALYVLLPVVAGAWSSYRKKRLLRCPETGETVEVNIDARKAAVTAAFGDSVLEVENCSLWPQRQGCEQECVELPESEMKVREARRTVAAH
ncbi:MAG: hypothetical protein HYY96_06675 [Candidatus Tectomicrobia bacterium]|nr:hypothetical protein [Candidatus Tectomicrobia bacterium]